MLCDIRAWLCWSWLVVRVALAPSFIGLGAVPSCCPTLVLPSILSGPYEMLSLLVFQ